MYFIDEEFASTKCWKNDIRFLVNLCFESSLANAAPSPLSGENAAVNIGAAFTIEDYRIQVCLPNRRFPLAKNGRLCYSSVRERTVVSINTQVFNARTQKENGTALGGRTIRAGGLVAFPTETVYGLGANGMDGEAVKKIFEAKGRPNDNPLILHIAKKSDVKPLWKHVPDNARRLMDAFWPGPLTLIYLKSDIVPEEVSAGLDTVAIRMPEHRTALALIRAAGVPIAAPSANISGKPSPTTAEHVLEDLDGRIDVLLDGGPCRVGVESTVISLVGKPTILRPGGITKEMLEQVIGPVEVNSAVLKPLSEDAVAASPGMKHKHYAPDCAVVVAEGSPRRAADIINREYALAESENKNCLIFATEQTKGYYKGKNYVIIGDREQPETLCANLFDALRESSHGVDIIFAESIPTENEGLAYMNRLLRASGFTVLNN